MKDGEAPPAKPAPAAPEPAPAADPADVARALGSNTADMIRAASLSVQALKRHDPSGEASEAASLLQRAHRLIRVRYATAEPPPVA
jgi:hypothetical protein